MNGYSVVSARVRNASTSGSTSPEIREACAFETPSIPSAFISSSTCRVETPSTYASCTTANSACSARRRGCSNDGNSSPAAHSESRARSSPPACPTSPADSCCGDPFRSGCAHAGRRRSGREPPFPSAPARARGYPTPKMRSISIRREDDHWPCCKARSCQISDGAPTGMSRPLLKFGGGSVEILRDVLH